MILKNTKQLIEHPENVKLKLLIYGLPGSGKTSFVSGAPDLGIAACETGHGKGLSTIAKKGIDFVEPESYADFETVCSGNFPPFKAKKSLALDSLSDMTRTFIKDYALSFPRQKGETLKRKAGVPEMDDYGVMGEVTRRLLRKLIDQPVHVVVTATLRIDKPDADTGQGQMLVGPDLPGQLFLGSTAMFDMVFCMQTRAKLRDPKDPKSRYTEHFLITRGNQGLIAKNRHNECIGKSLLPDEIIFQPNEDGKGPGTFSWILEQIQTGYAAALLKAA